jgi:hypothetical protein
LPSGVKVRPSATKPSVKVSTCAPSLAGCLMRRILGWHVTCEMYRSPVTGLIARPTGHLMSSVTTRTAAPLAGSTCTMPPSPFGSTQPANSRPSGSNARPVMRFPPTRGEMTVEASARPPSGPKRWMPSSDPT